MIVPMKKVTLVFMTKDKKRIMDHLRDLGVIHLEYARTPESEQVDQLTKKLSGTDRAVMLLLTEDGKPCGTTDLSGKEISDRVLELAVQRTEIEKDIHTCQRNREALLPWGEFDPDQLKQLRENGLFPSLCMQRKKDFCDFVADLPENASVTEISRDKNNIYCLVITDSEPDPEKFGTVTLPDTKLSVLDMELSVLKNRLLAIADEMRTLKTGLPRVFEYAKTISGKLEFSSACDGAEDKNQLSWIFGYIPETLVGKLTAAGSSIGLAMQIDNPAPDDEKVPTYIVKPAFANIMDPLFDFIGVTPGYRENDVNLFFLLFFPMFFGLIIGDAGYGCLFTAATLVCKYVLRKKESARLPLNLFLLLSLVTVVWGWLNGAWFGIPHDKLPDFMRGINFLADPVNSPAAVKFAHWAGLKEMDSFNSKFMQFLCFAIAAAHLPGARIFKFFTDIPGNWRAAGHLGWALLLFANAILAVNLIVYTDLLALHPSYAAAMYWMYGIGAALVFITVTASAILNLPSALIGSFVDVLSYIRLFAVALAGGLISQKFDEMGVSLMNSLPETLKLLGAVLLILVAVFGNLLNIALGFLSVMVHAIRLNTLEFSNHTEMQWSGIKFHPFKKYNK